MIGFLPCTETVVRSICGVLSKMLLYRELCACRGVGGREGEEEGEGEGGREGGWEGRGEGGREGGREGKGGRGVG